MLTIVLTEPNREVTWHSLEPFPIGFGDVRDVVEVRATEGERNMIMNTMSGLPTTDERSIRWYGDDAKFIVGNLLESPVVRVATPR